MPRSNLSLLVEQFREEQALSEDLSKQNKDLNRISEQLKDMKKDMKELDQNIIARRAREADDARKGISTLRFS